jgi:hypothetical protein
MATGRIATKEAAARYALEAFERQWRALIEDAAAYWRGEPPPECYRRHPHRRRRDAAEFVVAVIEDANRRARSG